MIRIISMTCLLVNAEWEYRGQTALEDTLAAMHPVIKKRCEKGGLGLNEYCLHQDELSEYRPSMPSTSDPNRKPPPIAIDLPPRRERSVRHLLQWPSAPRGRERREGRYVSEAPGHVAERRADETVDFRHRRLR